MKERKIFTEDLPMKKREEVYVIDWKSVLNTKVRFTYDDINGEITLIEAIDEDRFRVKYLENEYILRKKSIKHCNIGKIVNVEKNNSKLKNGQTIKDNKRDMTILNNNVKVKEKNGYRRQHCEYKCNICGYVGVIREDAILKRNYGCACCAGKVAVLGINTIWDTDRWMCDLGVSEEDAKKYTKCSNQRIMVKCPRCERQKELTISDIYRDRSIYCSCGDGVSYPEKVLHGVLLQLNIDYVTQLSKRDFEWCEDYRYDFYIPSINTIIETHGRQHYEECKGKKFKRSLQEEQENDRLKFELAKKNGIDNYVVVDCSYSDLEYIKNNILNSKINNIFNLSIINWNEVEKFATNTLIKEVCEYWNNREDWESSTTIANNNKWNIKSRTTILKYLKIGNDLGWCYYNATEERKKIGNKIKVSLKNQSKYLKMEN